MRVYLLYAQSSFCGHKLLGIYITRELAEKKSKILDDEWKFPNITEHIVQDSLE